MLEVSLRERPTLTDAQLNALYAVSWPSHETQEFGRVLAHSLTYFGAYRLEELIGFVYVAWDGGDHAFLLDPTVHPDYRRQGLGLALVRAAIAAAAASGAEWLHVDYDEHLTPFYQAAGFRPTPAGLIRLTP
jgi:GNAT superfamily N-acetyltransferase